MPDPKPSGPQYRANLIAVAVGLLLVLPLLAVLLRAFWLTPPGFIESPLLDKPAPIFELPALEGGGLVSLEQYEGKPVVLNFWATWCASCPAEHPYLVAIAQRYEGQVQFVGVAYNDKNSALTAWLNRNGGNVYPTLVDINGKVALAYGLFGVPETFVIDRHGVIRHKYVGMINPDALVGEIDRLLQEQTRELM